MSPSNSTVCIALSVLSKIGVESGLDSTMSVAMNSSSADSLKSRGILCFAAERSIDVHVLASG